MTDTRLQKFLAESGVASRRKSEELIKQGLVTVNGNIVTEMGVKVSGNDIVEVEGRKVACEEKKVYIMLNKPSGYITTVKDQFSRPSVLDLIKGVKERIYPVGRLDYDTSGLMILTNDGDFTYRMTHPKHDTDKVYIAEVEGIPGEQDIRNFETGLTIDNYVTSPAKMQILSKCNNSSSVEIVIHEGRNRQVRKMCETIGHPVLKLKRIAVGSINLGDLREGCWRYLDDSEIRRMI